MEQYPHNPWERGSLPDQQLRQGPRPTHGQQPLQFQATTPYSPGHGSAASFATSFQGSANSFASLPPTPSGGGPANYGSFQGGSSGSGAHFNRPPGIVVNNQWDSTRYYQQSYGWRPPPTAPDQGRDDWLVAMVHQHRDEFVTHPPTKEADNSADTKGAGFYRRIGVTGLLFNLFNDCITLHLHVLRAFEQESLLDNFIASPTEKTFLEEQGVELHNLLNFLAWRRSAMKVSLILGILSLAYSFPDEQAQVHSVLELRGRTRMDVNFTAFEKIALDNGLPPPSFADFSVAVALDIQRIISMKASVVLAINAVTQWVLCAVSSAFCLLAIFKWGHFGRSRKLMLWAWGLLVLPPFFASFVPARFFIEWDEAQAQVRNYRRELTKVIGADYRFNQLRAACKNIEEHGDEIMATQQIQVKQICSTVHRKVPNRTVRIPCSVKIWHLCHIDFKPLHEGCGKISTAFQNGKLDVAMQKAQDVCVHLNTTLSQVGSTSSGNLNDLLDDSSHYVQKMAEVATSFMLAVDGFRRMMPAALTIPNGLLKGALRVKILVPQSSTPGMLVTILPWLFCPLNWCIYSLFFQLVGSMSLFVGLFFLAFSPMVNLIIGRLYHFDKPMSDERMIEVSMKANRWNLVVSLISFFSLGYFFVTAGIEQAEKGRLQLIWQHVLVHDEDNSGFYYNLALQGVALTCSALSSYFRTLIAGADWIVGVVANDRRYENLLSMVDSKDGDLGMLSPSGGYGGSSEAGESKQELREITDREVVRRLRDQRTERMDGLAVLAQTY